MCTLQNEDARAVQRNERLFSIPISQEVTLNFEFRAGLYFFEDAQHAQRFLQRRQLYRVWSPSAQIWLKDTKLYFTHAYKVAANLDKQ